MDSVQLGAAHSEPDEKPLSFGVVHEVLFMTTCLAHSIFLF
jgi:hypothetical protein